jgi:uncharacterized protein (TIRG00374 family)
VPRIKIPLVVKAGVSAILLIVVLLKIDISSVAQVLAHTELPLCLLSLAVGLAAWLINTYKWQVLLGGSATKPSFAELFRLNMIAIFYNLIMPGQVGGEVVKGFRVAHLGVDGKRAAISVVVDRTTSLLALLVLGIAGLALSPSTVSEPDLVPWLISLAALLAGVTVILVTGAGLGRLGKLQSPIRRPVQKLNLHTWHLDLGSQSWSSLVSSLILAVLFQLAVVLTNYLLCLALDIPVTYIQLLWVVAAVSLLQSLPISVAGLGVREGAYVYLLGLQGIPEPMALALSLLIFATQIIFALVGGLLQLQEVLATRRKGILPG